MWPDGGERGQMGCRAARFRFYDVFCTIAQLYFTLIFGMMSVCFACLLCVLYVCRVLLCVFHVPFTCFWYVFRMFLICCSLVFAMFFACAWYVFRVFVVCFSYVFR